MNKLALLVLLGACTDELPRWRDNQPVHVITSPDLSPSSKQGFRHRVETDITRWRTELALVGCEPPFRYTNVESDDPNNSVSLISNERWTYKGAAGLWYDGLVSIRAEGDGTLDTYVEDPRWTVGLHELGHAIGLGHSKYIEGSPSIMTPSDGDYFVDPAKPLPARDVRDAACLLECGPCPQ